MFKIERILGKSPEALSTVRILTVTKLPFTIESLPLDTFLLFFLIVFCTVLQTDLQTDTDLSDLPPAKRLRTDYGNVLYEVSDHRSYQQEIVSEDDFAI
jgi:hypothetical protein